MLALPAIANAQSCCQIRKNKGQKAYDKGDYQTAIYQWEKGTKCPDAAECPDLARLLNKAEDDDAWKTARGKNTKAAYQEYLKKYPKGRHATEAKAKIAPPPIKPKPAEKETPAKKPQPAPDNFIRITGGTFRMGDLFDEGDSNEKPVRDVTLSDYYLSPHEVTFDEYDAFCTATGTTKPSDQTWGRGKRPVINVSWNDAVAYCNWLSEQRGLQKVYAINGTEVSANWNANGYRLPTEAEWEYAARQGGKKLRFGNGKDMADPKEINFDGSAGGKKDYSIAGEYRSKTVPVGSLNSPNSLGLHDMSGNVWEWCWDCYAAYPADAQTNPKGPDSGSKRVGRGGSWFGLPAYVRCAFRNSSTSGRQGEDLGFRLARAVR